MSDRELLHRARVALDKLKPGPEAALAWFSCVRSYGLHSGPAKGALLDIIRAVEYDPTLTPCFTPAHRRNDDVPRWYVWTDVQNRGGTTELESLIAALETLADA